MEKIKYCMFCGAELKQGDSYCMVCGKKQPVKKIIIEEEYEDERTRRRRDRSAITIGLLMGAAMAASVIIAFVLVHGV